MKAAIYGRAFSDSFSPFIQKFFDRLQDIKAGLLVYQPFIEYLKDKVVINSEMIPFSNHREIHSKVDFLFSIGGDGTFLDATRFVMDSGIPMIGINTGRLGFLSNISIDEIDEAIDAIENGRFTLDNRTLLKIETPGHIFGEENFALNEMTVHKKDTSSMIIIRAYLNGEFLNSYWADGLIIATPTGSTAYSLSCGGPIVLPGSGNFVITPVAPHNLNVRPIVVPDRSVITLKMEGRGDHFLVSLDSRSETIDSSVNLTISKNSFNINLLQLQSHSYSSTIRNKLNWGLDKRN